MRGLYYLQRKVVEGQIGEEGKEWHFGKVKRLIAWVDDGMEVIVF